MSIRNRLKKHQQLESKEEKPPVWVIEGSLTTHELYEAAKQEFRRVADLIKNGEATSPKDRKLVLAKIAERAGKDRSLINPRRQPELCDWITRLNHELEAIFDLHKTKPRQTKYRTKRELEREVIDLRRQAKEQSTDELRAIVEAIFESNMLDDRDKQAREISRLRKENQELIDKITRLQHQCREQDQQIAALIQALPIELRTSVGNLRLVHHSKEINNS